MRECVGGGAFAEMITGSLFGFTPQFGKELQLFEVNIDRDFVGTLVNAPFQGELIKINGGVEGVSIRSER